MKTTLHFPHCHLFNPPGDAFWVSCTVEETENIILPRMTPEAREDFEKHRDDYLSTWWAERNSHLAIPDRYYFLIAADGSGVVPGVTYLPYASQWNDRNTFVKIEPIEFGAIEELKHLRSV